MNNFNLNWGTFEHFGKNNGISVDKRFESLCEDVFCLEYNIDKENEFKNTPQNMEGIERPPVNRSNKKIGFQSKWSQNSISTRKKELKKTIETAKKKYNLNILIIYTNKNSNKPIKKTSYGKELINIAHENDLELEFVFSNDIETKLKKIEYSNIRENYFEEKKDTNIKEEIKSIHKFIHEFDLNETKTPFIYILDNIADIFNKNITEKMKNKITKEIIYSFNENNVNNTTNGVSFFLYKKNIDKKKFINKNYHSFIKNEFKLSENFCLSNLYENCFASYDLNKMLPLLNELIEVEELNIKPINDFKKFIEGIKNSKLEKKFNNKSLNEEYFKSNYLNDKLKNCSEKIINDYVNNKYIYKRYTFDNFNFNISSNSIFKFYNFIFFIIDGKNSSEPIQVPQKYALKILENKNEILFINFLNTLIDNSFFKNPNGFFYNDVEKIYIISKENFRKYLFEFSFWDFITYPNKVFANFSRAYDEKIFEENEIKKLIKEYFNYLKSIDIDFIKELIDKKNNNLKQLNISELDINQNSKLPEIMFSIIQNFL